MDQELNIIRYPAATPHPQNSDVHHYADLALQADVGEADRGSCSIVVNPALSGSTSTAIIGWYEGDECVGGEFPAAASAFCFAEGFDRVIGPMNGDTWHSYRARLIGESPSFFLDVPTPPVVAAQFREAGFRTIESYHSTTHILADTPVTGVAERREGFERDGLRFRPFDTLEPERDLESMHAIASAAFVGSPCYSPISLESFLGLYRPVLPVVDPAFVTLVENRKEEPIAFIFAIPDPGFEAKEQLVVKSVARLPQNGARGLGTFLVEAMHDLGRRSGYRRAINALMHDDNLSAGMVGGGEVIERYGLFGLDRERGG